MTKPAVHSLIVPAVHVTSDRLFAHVNIGGLQICFERDGQKLAPNAFAATAAYALHDGSEIAFPEISAKVAAAAVHALSQELARVIEVEKPRKLTFAQVQRIYGRAAD